MAQPVKPKKNHNKKMENRLTNLFTYQKSQNDYNLAFVKLKSILRPHFENIPNYDLIEETFIDCFIPAIKYYDPSIIGSVFYNVVSCLEFDENLFFGQISENIIIDILKEINNIKNDFTCLKYYKETGVEPKNQDNYRKKVYKFLHEVGIWEVEPYVGMDVYPDEWHEEGWYEWQYEWDVEFFEILNIAYYCNELEEVNEVYKLVWFIWLSDIFPQEIHPNAKIIWENLDYWKNIIDNELTEKVLKNQPEEDKYELDELEDNLSMEEKLEALKRKFGK